MAIYPSAEPKNFYLSFTERRSDPSELATWKTGLIVDISTAKGVFYVRKHVADE